MSTGMVVVLIIVCAVAIVLIVWCAYLTILINRAEEIRARAAQTVQSNQEQAASLYRKALFLDPRNQAALYEYSGLCLKLDDPHKAEQLCNRGIQIASKKNDRLQLAYGWHQLGKIVHMQGDNRKAGNYHKKALDVADELNNSALKARALNNLALLDKEQGRLSAAYKKYEEAIILLEYLSEEEISKENIWEVIASKQSSAAVYINKADLDFELGQLKQAEKSYNIALEIYLKSDNKNGLADIYAGMGNVSFQQGKLEKAEEEYEKALELDTYLGNIENKAGILGNLGNISFKYGKYEEANEFHFQALELNKRMNNSIGQASNLNNLGLVAIKTKKLDAAKDYVTRALDINRNLNQKHNVILNLLTLGNIAYEGKEWSEAEVYYKQCQSLLEEVGDKYLQAAVVGNLGLIAKENGEFDTAKYLLERSLEISEAEGYREFSANQLSYLAELALCRELPEQACEFWDQSKSLYKKMGMSHKVREIDEAMQNAGCGNAT